jgi:hypothetical protein
MIVLSWQRISKVQGYSLISTLNSKPATHIPQEQPAIDAELQDLQECKTNL